MTPREEVEKLAYSLGEGASLYRHEPTAAMLRALLARAEAAAALAECERLRLGGCARGQTTTQWCAEAVQMMTERDAALALAERHMNEKHKAQRQAAEDWDGLQQQIAAARAEAARLREAHTELDAWARAEITRLREALIEARGYLRQEIHPI